MPNPRPTGAAAGRELRDAAGGAGAAGAGGTRTSDSGDGGDRPGGGASFSTELDLTNVIGDWERTSAVPRSARFDYPERIEIRDGGIYLVPQAEIYEHAPLWQGGLIEEVEGEPGRIRLQSANDAMIEYGWALRGDALTFTVEDDLRIEYRRAGD